MVIGWLTRVAACLAVVGVLLFDGISLAVAHVSVDSDAQDAAVAAAGAYHQSPDVSNATAAAAAALPGKDELGVNAVRIAADGSATVTVHRTAPTLLIRLVPPLRHLASVSGSATAPAPTG